MILSRSARRIVAGLTSRCYRSALGNPAQAFGGCAGNPEWRGECEPAQGAADSESMCMIFTLIHYSTRWQPDLHLELELDVCARKFETTSSPSACRRYKWKSYMAVAP